MVTYVSKHTGCELNILRLCNVLPALQNILRQFCSLRNSLHTDWLVLTWDKRLPCWIRDKRLWKQESIILL